VLKTRADWQITVRFEVGLTGSYTVDNYYDSTLGVQMGHAGQLDLDAAYQVADGISIGGYLSWHKNSRSILSSSAHTPDVPSTTLWSNSLNETDYAFGINSKQKFMGGKLQFLEDLSYDFDTSTYDTELVSGIAAATGNTGQNPIRNRIIQLRLGGSYKLSKSSSINAGYMFQRVISNDFFYNAYMYGYTASQVLPAGITSPTYNINVFYITYRYTF
jgi:hypothetical protein